MTGSLSPFALMQQAVDIVNGSPHPVNKIAAALSGTGPDGLPYSVAMTNYWPDRIHTCFGAETRIGNASGTIHAETACILTAPKTDGASLFVTDPFCPNCAKNMAEAGIRTITIDHKGFAKDFATRRNNEFLSMSLRIAAKAGIAVYEINRKEETLSPIQIVPEGYAPREERPVKVETIETGLEGPSLAEIVRRQSHSKRRFAAAIARAENGSAFGLTAFSHPAIGFSYEADKEELGQARGKYSFMLEPVNRLLMNAARRGLKLLDGLVYSSQVPTAREMVNLVGAGMTTFHLGDAEKARDPGSIDALKMLSDSKVLTYSPLPERKPT